MYLTEYYANIMIYKKEHLYVINYIFNDVLNNLINTSIYLTPLSNKRYSPINASTRKY